MDNKSSIETKLAFYQKLVKSLKELKEKLREVQNQNNFE
jgi:hypothetical protein